MKTNKTFQYRLCPTDEQNEILHRHGGHIRFAWNKLLEFANNKSELIVIDKMTLQKQIVELKNSNEFLKETYSQPLQVQADRLDKTFKRSRSKEVVKERKKKIAIASHIEDPIEKEKKLRKAENYGYPNFKSKIRHQDSIFYPQNFKFDGKNIFFPKIGWIKSIHHIPLEGVPKSVTIKQDGEFWNCSICCEVKINEIPLVPLEKANLVGVDMGVKTFATFSDGTVIENPKFLKKCEKRIKIEQKKLSRKELEIEKKDGKEVKKSSHNREKQVKKVQKQFRYLRNCRRNFLHQETHRMITKYDGFCVETLNIINMIKKAKKENKLNFVRSLYDVSWFEFMKFLEYKSFWYSKYFVKIDKFFPSTRMCPFCGHIQKEITLDDRVLTCPHCGRVMDRDPRAALTILQEGIRLLRELYCIPQEPWELKTVGESSLAGAFDEAVTSSVSPQAAKKAKAFKAA